MSEANTVEERWAPLESNPTALNQFAQLMGVNTDRVAFSDCWGLDEELLAFLPQPCYAMILLFPFPLPDGASNPIPPFEEEGKEGAPAREEEVTWIPQRIGNACGTMAAMHALCHAVQEDPTLTPATSPMAHFVGQLPGLSPEARGQLLASFEAIRHAHEAVVHCGDTQAPSADSQVNHHFTCFVRAHDHLWELDGRQAGPLCHGGPCTPHNFVYQAAAVIKSKFIERVSAHETGFSVLALGAVQN